MGYTECIMKDLIIVGSMCVVALLIGVALLVLGPDLLARSDRGTVPAVLAQGSYARGIDTEKNYRIRTEEEFSELWRLIHGNDAPPRPSVDFETQEVLAVFDGSHSSSGYAIEVSRVVDERLTRVVHITHKEPGASCMTSFAQSSPFVLVAVPKVSPETVLSHIDTTEVVECS